MFTKILPSKTKESLALLTRAGVTNDFYLAGGTALALQLGHRLSFDLDYFSQTEFNSDLLIQKLKYVKEVKLYKKAWGTVMGTIQNIKFSFFYYHYPLLYPLKEILKTKLADLRDIAPMKLSAISDRGTKRDFIDLYFILKTGVSLQKLLKFYDKKFGKLAVNLVHLQKSLIYFADAEDEQMPQMVANVSWEKVKDFITRETKKISWKVLASTL
jgi:hypothetical protein